MNFIFKIITFYYVFIGLFLLFKYFRFFKNKFSSFLTENQEDNDYETIYNSEDYPLETLVIKD